MGNGKEGAVFITDWKRWLDKWFYWLVLAGICINVTGLLLPVMEPDGALYATLSKNIVLSHDFINLRIEGKDWLDKPHFQFWITALSFKIFGINGFAYKLPAFLFWLMGAYYVYAWAKKLYTYQTARLSVLIYLAAEHLIISNNDVRAEPYLTGLIIAAVYFYYKVYKENKLFFIVPGSLLLAAAVMTKGIFIAVLVASGFIIEWILKKKWNEFLNPRWWLAILLLILFISPELYCLYVQFDLHPEKIVFARTHVSGIRFFFWDSQFGRFLNTGPIKGKGDLLFYVHTLLWGFLPWSVFPFLLLASQFNKRKRAVHHTDEYICPAIFITGFILFSLSKFQLPHYLNILYPFLSIMVAQYLIGLNNPVHQKITLYAQNILCFLFFVSSVLLCVIFGLQPLILITIVLIGLAVLFYLIFPGKGLGNVIGRSFSAVLIVNLLLNSFFYPELFKYQSGMIAAEYLKKNNYSRPAYTFSEFFPEFAFEFYSAQPVYQLKSSDLNHMKDSILLFMPNLKSDSLRSEGFTIREMKTFPHFHVSQLTGTFFNQHTRNRAVDSSTLAFILPKKMNTAEKK